MLRGLGKQEGRVLNYPEVVEDSWTEETGAQLLSNPNIYHCTIMSTQEM